MDTKIEEIRENSWKIRDVFWDLLFGAFREGFGAPRGGFREGFGRPRGGFWDRFGGLWEARGGPNGDQNPSES